MIIKKLNINIDNYINTPRKIYHSAYGKIVNAIIDGDSISVLYETESMADQEWPSWFFAVETNNELPISNPKYLRSVLYKDKILHFYTNIR